MINRFHTNKVNCPQTLVKTSSSELCLFINRIVNFHKSRNSNNICSSTPSNSLTLNSSIQFQKKIIQMIQMKQRINTALYLIKMIMWSDLMKMRKNNWSNNTIKDMKKRWHNWNKFVNKRKNNTWIKWINYIIIFYN